MVCTPKWLRQLQLPSIRVGTALIPPSFSVCNLGVFIDSDLSIRLYVNEVAGKCYFVLWQLCSVRRSDPADMFQMFVGSLVVSRLDYSNATLAGVLRNLLRRFQSVNTAAITVDDLPRFVKISLSLAVFYLSTDARLALLAYCCQHGTALSYLAN